MVYFYLVILFVAILLITHVVYWISNLKDKEYKEYNFITIFTTAGAFVATLVGLAVLVNGISKGNDYYIASGSVLISVFIAFFIQMASSLDNAVIQKKTEKKLESIQKSIEESSSTSELTSTKQTLPITNELDINVDITLKNDFQPTNKKFAYLGATILVAALFWSKIKRK
ncbi:hypothetical protein [Psychrobacillus sp. MER TA 171]|uniref:hypothetical protein n=1 Tax=Psychrobacillus sp. MER TA 171 TaxID=2939577 RepID=UPI00203CE54B|nr:hypothetical protein [Psychrobacillus sp. MER TA 171]MCM3358067.1 hypothetical protein [Psychrobacillus sp. MER TA 171]